MHSFNLSYVLPFIISYSSPASAAPGIRPQRLMVELSPITKEYLPDIKESVKNITKIADALQEFEESDLMSLLRDIENTIHVIGKAPHV
jgi:hypothetical protein